MAAQLLHVVGGRLVGSEALSALLQINQRHLDPGRLAFASHSHENVLDIEATVLPTPLVHAREVFCQGLQHLIMHGFTMTLATAPGVPMFYFLEPVQ
ncbi:hypothetical protein D3C87_1733720 [compost metagenome]